MRVFIALVAFFLLEGAPNSLAEAPEGHPLPPGEAAKAIRVPEGFNVSLFAGEPDVRQPIGFCFDDRGRLWVAEAYSYPQHATTGSDRIVIFEDVDNDGRFDKRTVFYDKLNYVTGVEVGFGGAWVMSPPYFYFIPDRDDDDVPDGEPEVLLDGFGNHSNAHNLANGLAWGPDGWLYGTHGRTNWSLIGKPGAAEKERARFDGGVFRYHPTRRVWEPYADGTTNPWGIDWNDVGEAFIGNCVNPHLFHVIPGAHYEPWRNRESSRHAYQRIDTIADHLHFLGHDDVHDGIGSEEEKTLGGGHAHCGLMVYLGDNWPDEYRHDIFMHNIHGRRINRDSPRRHGSGYIASHKDDVALAADPWFMGVMLAAGPDGAVYSLDWSDTGECHSLVNTARETGRIYKIAYGEPQKPHRDLATMSDEELVALQLEKNEWWVRHARRNLQERAFAGRDMSVAANALRELLVRQSEVPQRLRALWSLHAIGETSSVFLATLLDDRDESIRSWAVRLLCETPPSADHLSRLASMARDDSSPLVRLHLASSLQRFPPSERWEIAAALASRAEDASDANIPLMLWYAIEPLIEADRERFIALARTCQLPLLRRFIARRAASLAEAQGRDAALATSIELLAETSQPDQLWLDVLGGIREGLEGQRNVAMPPAWPAVYAKATATNNADLRRQAIEVALLFGDPRAVASLRRTASDAKSDPERRREAVVALSSAKTAGLSSLLLSLVSDKAVGDAAIRGLAQYADPRTPQVVLSYYPSLSPPFKQDAVQTLSSRTEWALALLEAIEQGKTPRSDVSAYAARQMMSLGNARVSERLKEVWGELRVSPAERAREIAGWKKRLAPATIAKADRARGRVVYERTCAKCHKLFGDGGDIGPDITGAQRHNLDYLLENLVDPSSLVSRDYQMEIVQTTAGRTITGVVSDESATALKIRSINETIAIPLEEIEERAVSPLSIMPDGLLANLSPDEARDLIAYLMGTSQSEAPP